MTISNDKPSALFLVHVTDCTFVPTLAASCGFRALIASWRHCESRVVGLHIREACEVDADGRVRPLPNVIIIKPALIAVLSPYRRAREKGRKLAVSSGAIWGHYDFLVDQATECKSSRTHADNKHCKVFESSIDTGYAYGIVESYTTPPLLRLASPLTVVKRVESSTTDLAPDSQDALAAELEVLIQEILEKAERSLHAIELGGSTLYYRNIAPIAFVLNYRSAQLLPDLLCQEKRPDKDIEVLQLALAQWLQYVWCHVLPPAPLTLLDRRTCISGLAKDEYTITSELFPSFFGTPQYINTQLVPDASFVHLDPALIPLDVVEGESAESALRRILCRRRCLEAAHISANLTELRLVETGVGRTCLVKGLRLKSHEYFYDFTVMGIGLTPFSEGGFVEMGRKIDGKAAMIRAWHRKSCAERLESEGCRTGRVVAVIELPDESMEMPDGTSSPVCMIVRGFRCALRIKQLDPIVCALHSTQHTPLISAYLARSVHDLRFALGLPPAQGLADDEALAREIEFQGASQASLRRLLATSVPEDNIDDWAILVRRVRLEVIDAYAPALINLAKLRLGKELNFRINTVSDADYLSWFASSLGEQLAAWRRLRFLHDYHHPGISRWQPESLFSLGENNISLLAEFPDLDTGLFVDDEEAYLTSTLQLKEEDITLLRQSFLTFHYRDVLAAETAVRTLAMVMFRDDNEVIEDSTVRFRRCYKNA